MKIIVDLINKSLKVLENEKNIYVGNNNADVLKLYCYNGGYHLENEFVSITGLLSNGRKIGPFTTDSAYDEEYIDGKLHTLANFTLTRQNGFTLSEGQLNITIWHNKTNDSGAIVSKQAIGNLLFNVIKTANVDDNIIITDANGDVIYNFKLEIENIQNAINSVNSELLNVNNELLNVKKQIPYGDRMYVKFSHLTANNTIENLYDAFGDYNYITEDNVEYKFYIELGDGTILENIHIKTYSEYYDITSIIRNGIQFKVYMGRIWYSNISPTITEFIAQHSTVVTYKDIEDFVNFETLGDIVDGIKEEIPYGDRKHLISFNLTKDSTFKELVDELKSDEMFDENNEGKFYIKLSDDTVLENIHIKLKYLTKPERKTVYYINSIIREKNNIKIYIATLNDSSVLTINELIAQHNQIATEEYVNNLLANFSSLDLRPVEVLPTENISTTSIYLLKTPNTDETNIYEEWIYVNSKWELIGTTKVELPTKVSQLENDANYATEEFVNEKIASAGGTNIPTDLLDRVETLETLSDEAVYMEDTEFDVEEETGGSGSGSTSGTPSKTYQELTGPFFNNQDHIKIYNLSDKYTIIDLSKDVQRLEDSQGGDVSIELTNEDYTNAVVIIRKPLSASIPNLLYIYFGRRFIVCKVQNEINVEGMSMDNNYDLIIPFTPDHAEIRIEYDEFGAIKVYPYQDWEI